MNFSNKTCVQFQFYKPTSTLSLRSNKNSKGTVHFDRNHFHSIIIKIKSRAV